MATFKLSHQIIEAIMNKFTTACAIAALSVNIVGNKALAENVSNISTTYYVDDTANMSVMLPRILACILDQSGVGADERLTKATWAGLIDETLCNIGGDDGVVTYAKTVISSDRASENTPQVLNGWMDTSMKEKMIMDVVLNQGPTALDPYGRFKISFYRVNPDLTDPTKDITTVSDLADIENDNVAMYGFVYVYGSGDDIVLDSVLKDTTAMGGTNLRSKVVIVGGDTDNVRYAVNIENQNRPTVTALGATSADKTFRYLLANGQPAGAECKSRNLTLKNAWNNALYSSSNGEILELENPSFSFTDPSGNYGDVNSNWFWIEGDGKLALTPSQNEMSVTTNSGESKTLLWMPGDFSQETTYSYTPSVGDSFSAWDANALTDVTYIFVEDQTLGNHFYKNGVANLANKVADRRRGYSRQFDMNVEIAPDGNGGRIYTRSKNRKIQPKPNDGIFYDGNSLRTLGNEAKLICAGWNCPTKNLGMSSSDLATHISGYSDNNVSNWSEWSTFHDVNGQPDDVHTYFVAPLVLPSSSGLTPGALYLDDPVNGTQGVLDASDDPVYFNFKKDGRTGAIYNWDGTRATSLETQLARVPNNDWTGFYFDLALSSTCDLSNVAQNQEYEEFQKCDKIRYHTNSYDGNVAVKNADGSFYNFSDSIVLKLDNFNPSIHDMNKNYLADALGLSALPEIGTVRDGEWNPLTGTSCDVSSWANDFASLYPTLNNILVQAGIPLVDGVDNYCLVPVTPQYFAGQDRYFNFDGRMLHVNVGLNSYYSDKWYSLINLESGVELTDASNGANRYKVKPISVDEVMQNLTTNLDPFDQNAISDSIAACGTLDDNDPAEIVFDLVNNTTPAKKAVMMDLYNSLPTAAFGDTYARPTTLWSERPSGISPSNACFVKNKKVACP